MSIHHHDVRKPRRAGETEGGGKAPKVLTEDQIIAAIRASVEHEPAGSLVYGTRVVTELARRLGYGTPQARAEFAERCTRPECGACGER